MKRLTILLGVCLPLTLLTGCPDGRSSRHPQGVAESAALKAEINALKARIAQLEGGDKAALEAMKARLAALEAKQSPIVIHNHIPAGMATAPSGKTPIVATPTPAPTPTPTVKTTPTPTPTKTGRRRRPRVTNTSGGSSKKLAQRKGYDAWNTLRPRTRTETPKVGGSIRVVFSAEPKLISYYLDNSSVTSYISNPYLMETLVDQDPITFEWKPWLAESWITDDMLFEVVAEEKLEGVKFDVSMQKWTKKQGKDIQTWRKWSVRKNADGTHTLLTLKEHIGKASQAGDTWTLTTTAGESKTFPAAKVARVNKGSVFTFKLRKDVKFHDGQPMTADDVVFTVGFIKCEFVDAPSIRSYFQDLRPAEKIDDYTVRMIYENQYFKALEFTGGVMVHPKHVFDPDNLLENDPKKFGEQFNKHPAHRSPIGTGPYKFVKWDAGKELTVKRVGEGYWNKDRAGYLDTITWRFIPEAQTALASLRAGEVDFMPRMRAEQYFKETNTADFKSRFVKCIWYYGNFGYIGWNMRRAPFNDINVRRALAYGSFDVQKDLIDNLLYGAGTQVAGTQYYYGPMYDKSVKPLSFNLEKARKLLRDAGWFDRDGDGVIENADRKAFSFEMLMPQGSATNRQLMAIMAENLGKLGIKMEVKELEWAVFVENLQDRKFDACRLGWGQPIESDSFQIWHSSNSENRGSNHVGFVNEEADALILKIRETLDDEKRKKLHGDFQRMIYAAQPYMFLVCAPEKGSYDPRFHGVRFTPVRPGYDLREWYEAGQE